jgi:hypothetical protein
VTRRRRLRKLTPDAELIRRRAADEPLRQLAPDYDVWHTTLSRYFARPEVAEQLEQARKQLRAEERAAEARRRAEQKAEERAARRTQRQQPAAERRAAGRAAASSASGPNRHVPPLKLKPFSDEWLAWYSERRHLSEIDMLNHNDAFRGVVPPLERRAREQGRSPSLGRQTR